MGKFTLLAVRFLLAFAFLAALFRRRLLQIDRRTLLSDLAMGSIYFCVMTAELTALKTVETSTVSFVTNTAVVIVPLIQAALSRRWLERRVLFGALALIASFLFETPHLPGSGTEWLVVLALALVCSGFGFTLQPVAQSGTTADHAALFCALNPFVAAALGAVCFHEHFGIVGQLGGALILAGIVVSCWPQKTGG